MDWIRIRMDPELLHGSGTRKIQSWIRIRNKSFQIHNTALIYLPRYSLHFNPGFESVQFKFFPGSKYDPSLN